MDDNRTLMTISVEVDGVDPVPAAQIAAKMGNMAAIAANELGLKGCEVQGFSSHTFREDAEDKAKDKFTS